MKEKIKTLWQIFFCFFKIGAFTMGGGYAMIPLIQKETVEKKKWISDEDILEIIAIAESTPGPIAINSSTFVGYRVAGFWGAFFGTLGMVLPSFTIILTVSFVLRKLQEFTVVKYAFFGIRAGVLALILKALWSMYRQSKKNVISYIIMTAAFVCVAVFEINAIFVLIGCALIGLVYSFIAQRRSKNDLS